MEFSWFLISLNERCWSSAAIRKVSIVVSRCCIPSAFFAISFSNIALLGDG
jgi:hypothetical protein